MAIGGFYKIDNPLNAAMQGMGQTAGTLASMSKRSETKTDDKKSLGGASMGAMGGASMGASLATGLKLGGETGGVWGAGIGAALGALSYLFS